MRNAAIVLVVLALLYRLLPTLDMKWANFPPMTALAFCGAIYFRNRRFAILPFAGLCLTDLYIDWFYARQYHYHMEFGAYFARALAFAAGLGIGLWVARRKSWHSLLGGSFLGAVLFYLITNTQSWLADAFYPKTLAGWWQALTFGHPEHLPTYMFFGRSLFGDIMFTGLFAGVMEWMAKRSGEPSLLEDEEEEEEAEGEEQPAEVEVKE